MPSFTTVHLWCRTPTRPVVLDADATRDGRRDARTIARSRRAMEIIPPHRSRVADATKRRRRRRAEDGRPSLLTRPRRWRHERRQRRGWRRGKRAGPPSAVPPSARSSDVRRVFSSFVVVVIVVRLPRSPSDALLFIRLPTDAFPRALYPTLSIRFVGIAPSSRRRFPRRVVARRSSSR